MSAVLSAARFATPASHPSSAGLAADCFHCGLPLAPGAHWSVDIDHVARPMCCPGCQAVAQAIVDNGFADYYGTRTAWPATGDLASLLPRLKLYDAPDVAGQFADQPGADADTGSHEATFSVDGIRCAACVWLIERRLARVSGVQSVNLNVATERLYVRWDRVRCKPSDILLALREVGYAGYPFDAARHGEQLRRTGKTLFRQLFVAGLSMMQVMMYALPAYIGDGSLEPDMANLMRWASLMLTIPAVFYSARPFFKGAWSALKNRSLGMDVPVALGISAAFIASVVALLRGNGEVYFDSVTMFIFLLLCSRYLELAARRKAASALERLQYALPDAASAMTDYPASRDTLVVPAAQLAEGDVILVKPGEAVAADGIILEGETAIDLSLLTGESRPQHRLNGDFVPGGAVNATQAILLRVSKPARDSTLSALLKLIERAGQAKPQLALWADKVAAWFVAALLLLAVVIFAYWHWADPARAWPIAIAVLVVSCPCALSLATPSALAAATDRLVHQGVLIVQPHVLETLYRATHFVFDKTGTLTDGKATLRHVHLFGAASQAACLQIAAALEACNAHPLGQAIIAAAAQQRAEKSAGMVAGEVEYRAGQGLEGIIDGIRYRLGCASFVEELSGAPCDEAATDTMTPVYLGSDGVWLARFDLADAVRSDAREVIDHLRANGKKVILLSGDQHAVTQRIAEQLGIDVAYGEYLPDQKLALVQELQARGAIVAMVGDGINDAAVLRAADVSFAMGSGAALAKAHADTVLLSGRLSSVWEAVGVASKTMWVIRQNLAWATLYNLIAIPAAALGLLNPWLSGIGMSLSSVIVIGNALRLRRVPRASGSDPRTIAGAIRRYA